jgi:hypothetical protein
VRHASRKPWKRWGIQDGAASQLPKWEKSLHEPKTGLTAATKPDCQEKNQAGGGADSAPICPLNLTGHETPGKHIDTLKNPDQSEGDQGTSHDIQKNTHDFNSFLFFMAVKLGLREW